MRILYAFAIMGGATVLALVSQRDAAHAACPGYSASVATISPCTAAPGAAIAVSVRRANVVPGSVSFLTGVNNGIAVGGITPVSGGPGAYTFTVPAFLCTAGSGSTFAVRLADANGVNQGEIGRLTVDCRAGAGAAGAGGSGAGAFVDGNFSGAPNPGSFTTYAAGSTAIPGWRVTKATIDLIGTYWSAPGGMRSVDLDGTPGFGAISQTFKTVPGKRYSVSFLLSGNSDGEPAIKKLIVNAGPSTAVYTVNSQTFSAQSHKWARKTLSFVARGPSSTLTFTSGDTTGGQCGPVIADIRVH